MTSVPTSSTPAAPPAVPLAALDVDPAASAGRARATGGVGTPGADVVIESTAKPTTGSRATSTAKKASGTSAAKKKKTTTAKAGYAASASLPKDLAFLKDPKLSTDEKLIRLAAYLGARYDAEIQKKMEAVGGGGAAKSSGTKSGGTAAKKKGFWGKLLDAAKTGLPALGLSMQLLKNTTTKNMLKQLGGPALAAAATALGFPQAAPLLAKLGPQIVDYAAAGLQAIEKAATAEASGSAASSSGGASSGSQAATPGGSLEQLGLMEIQLLLNKQKEMFGLLSSMLRMTHDTRSQVIANIR